MEVVKDVVEGFTTKSGTAKGSGKPYTVNIMLLKEFGPVSLGFKKPEAVGLTAGDHVAMEVDFKFGEYQYQRTVDISTEATITTPKKKFTPRPSGGRDMGKFPIDQFDGQMSIIHQSALKAAVEYHDTLVISGGLKEPMTPEQIVEVAYVFADFSSGAHLAKLAKEK